MREHAFAICERVAELMTLFNDHAEGGRFTPAELIERADAILKEEGLIKVMWEVGYFPEGTPPPGVVGDH